MPGLFPSQRELAYSDRLMADTDAMRQDQRSFLMARQQQQAAAAEMAARERMQGQAIAAEHASQRFAADRRSSDEYNARNDAYSMATDPRLAAIERLRLNEAMGREQALMGTQSANRINEHFEAMQDDRARMTGVANNQARLDSALLMQRGNIDARLQMMQGRQIVDRDKVKSGLAIDEDAWSRMQNRKHELLEMENQERQAGVQLSEPDQKAKDALWEEYRRIEDEASKPDSRMTPRQALIGLDHVTRRLGQLRGTVKAPSPQEQLNSRIATAPNGAMGVFDAKGNWQEIKGPPGIRPEQVDPEAKAAKANADRRKQEADDVKLLNQTIKDIAMEYDGLETENKPSVQEIRVEAMRRLGKLPPSDPVNMPHAMRAMPGMPVAPDPRSGGVKAVTPSRPQPQRVVPGQPGPVDPRMLMMQGRQGISREQAIQAMLSNEEFRHTESREPKMTKQEFYERFKDVDHRMSDPAYVDEGYQVYQEARNQLLQRQPAQAPPQRPMVGQNQRTGEPPAPVRAVTPQNIDAVAQQVAQTGDGETAAALQIVKEAAVKHGGMPKRGTPDYETVQQALALLNARGMNASGGTQRSRGEAPTYRRPSLSSRNYAE